MGKRIVLKAGESIKVQTGHTVRYANLFKEPCEYIAICTPAFPKATAGRENGLKDLQWLLLLVLKTIKRVPIYVTFRSVYKAVRYPIVTFAPRCLPIKQNPNETYFTSYHSKMLRPFFSAYVLMAPRKTAEMAFTVFCKVRKGRIRPHQKEFLFPAKKEVVSSNGHQIQVYEWPGEGPTILLVHGWESNTWRWHKLIAHLQRAKYRILAFDAPGHGGSSGSELYVPLYAKVTHDLLQRYQPKHIIGHSVGGMTILFNEYKNPDPHIEKMVTIGAPSEFHEIMHHYQQLLGFSNRVMAAVDDFVQARFGFTIAEFSSARFAIENQKKVFCYTTKRTPLRLSMPPNRYMPTGREANS